MNDKQWSDYDPGAGDIAGLEKLVGQFYEACHRYQEAQEYVNKAFQTVEGVEADFVDDWVAVNERLSEDMSQTIAEIQRLANELDWYRTDVARIAEKAAKARADLARANRELREAKAKIPVLDMGHDGQGPLRIQSPPPGEVADSETIRAYNAWHEAYGRQWSPSPPEENH